MPYSAGTLVRTHARTERGHTRLPGYLQEKSGVVIASLGEFPFSDARAATPGSTRTSKLYTIEFQASDLWPYALANDRVRADLFEEYFEPL